MAEGDLTILGTEHLPREQTLLVKYGLSETGSWMYSLCHCGYRGVCQDNWVIMIPNHQHPRHTDAREGQALTVGAGGTKGIFAWNYGGIVGVAPEDFDSDHSYLVQLTMMKDCSPIAPTGNRIEPTGKIGVGPTGFTGKFGGPIVTGKRIPPDVPDPQSPPTPGIPPLIPPPNPGYGTVVTVNFPALGGAGGEIFYSGIPPVGNYRLPPISMPPVELYNKIPRIPIGIKEEGILSLDDGGGSSTAGPQNFGNLDTEPDGWKELNGGKDGSWIFGDGDDFVKEGTKNRNFASNVIDITDLDPPGTKSPATSRDVSPDGEHVKDSGINFPVITSIPFVPGAEIEGLVSTEDDLARISISQNAITLGIRSDPASMYSSSSPVPVAADTVDVGDDGDTIIVLSSDSIEQGKRLSVSAAFIPRGADAIIPVVGKLVATDSLEHSYNIITTDTIYTSKSQPAGMAQTIRTDVFPIGKLHVTAIFSYVNGKTAGIVTDTASIIQPVSEGSDYNIDTYNDIKRDDISDGLRNLTQVSNSAIDLIIPQGSERNLILSPIDTTLSSNGASLVIAQKVIDRLDRGMSASIYDLAGSSEDNLVGSKLQTESGTPIKKYGSIVLSTSGPTTVNGKEVFQDEHIVGHIPVSTALSSLLLNIHGFNESDYQDNDILLYIHRDLKLRDTSRTSILRSGTKVTVSYNVPYSNEVIGLLVLGFTNDSLPSSVSFYTSSSDINGAVTFSDVVASREQYIGLFSHPHRVGVDGFYTDLIGI